MFPFAPKCGPQATRIPSSCSDQDPSQHKHPQVLEMDSALTVLPGGTQGRELSKSLQYSVLGTILEVILCMVVAQKKGVMALFGRDIVRGHQGERGQERRKTEVSA